LNDYKDKFMKMMKYSVIAALALGGLVMTTPMTFAQDSATTPTATQNGRGQRGQGQTIEAMTKALSLTEAQVKEAKPLFEKRATAMKELRAKNLDRTEMRPEMQKIQKAFTDGMNKILTADQKTKWEEQRKAAAEKARNRAPQQ
jgi:hypothetical protein